MANWNKRFMEMAKHVTSWSKDRSTKVSAIITDKDHTILSIGYNGFPRGAKDDIDSRHERPAKYFYTEHAERNAIYNAVRSGVCLKDATIYLPWFPCVDCGRAIIQSGITKVVATEPDYNMPKWGEHFKITHELFEECGIDIEWYVFEGEGLLKEIKPIVDLEWNYETPQLKDHKSTFFGDQSAWNATLVTLINQASANIFKTVQRNANKVRVNSKLVSILETFPYYHKDEKMLGNRYKIVIDENLSDDEIWAYYDGRHGFSKEDDVNNRHAKIKILNFY